MIKKNMKPAKGQVLHDLFREIFELQSALARVMDTVHEKTGLSTSQHKIIRTLNHLGPATVPDMAALLGVSRQFVQTVCNNMYSIGLIEFKDNPRHKRSKLVLLTEPGRIAFRKARQKENMIIEHALPNIEQRQAKEAYDLLKRIREIVDRLSDEEFNQL